MVETFAAIGFSAVTILQVANLWQGKRTAQKVENMVTNDRCLERQAARQKAMDSCKREIHIVERKMDAHIHNGNGLVKYKPVDLRE